MATIAGSFFPMTAVIELGHNQSKVEDCHARVKAINSYELKLTFVGDRPPITFRPKFEDEGGMISY